MHTCIYIYPRGPRFSDDRTPVVAPLQMITLYHAPRQGGVGWGVGWGGVYYRSWNVDHVVDAPCSIFLVAGDAQVVPVGYQCIHMYIYIYTVYC